VGDHRRTGARGAHYVVEALPLEDIEEMTCDRTGLVEEARVEGRLPAAGLAFGVDQVYAEPPQNAHHAYPHLWVYKVNVARNKKSHLHRTHPSYPDLLLSNSPASS
jgi:hypothetical protein